MKHRFMLGLFIFVATSLIGCAEKTEQPTAVAKPAPTTLPSDMPKELQGEVQKARQSAQQQGDSYGKAMGERYKNGPPK